ncbi:DUF1934 domain-containing protein [Paenibacillus filicis]|uniref:DUF1934 domain-containing protein n=1 Tax=Paenibacillus filicis TaxID=669464 RepID=A0ABU9DSS9_9BACL
MNERQESGTGPDKTEVRIRLLSSADGQQMDREMPGVLIEKGSWLYLRYEEPEEAQMGRTTTTVRLHPEEVRIIRHGDVSFEQTFAAGRKHVGYMDTPHGRMELETLTQSVELKRPAAGRALPLEASWCYELTAMGEAAGGFEVRLQVTAGT